MKISELADDLATVKVNYRGHEAKVTYRVSKWTHESMAQLVVERVASIVDSWDVTDDAGTPIPLEVETLKSLPFGFLTAILDDIGVNARLADLPEAPSPSAAS